MRASKSSRGSWPVAAIDEITLLKGLVTIYSPTGQTDIVTEYLVQCAERLGLKAAVDKAGNIQMVGGRGPKHVMFLCHVDTVPGELKVHQEGPFITGRGSVDAKGCLAGAMIVASMFANDERGKVEVLAVVDEEGPSLGVRERIKGDRPDVVIVGEPSGWEGITIGYKGSLRLKCQCVTPKYHAGFMVQNSIQSSVDHWEALEAFCIKESERVEGGGKFDIISPTLVELNTHDNGIHVSTTMEIDVRFPPGYNLARLRRFIEADRANVDVEYLEEEPAVLVGKNNELVRALLKGIRSLEGEPVFKKKTGTSDMNVTAATWHGTPIVAYGPGDSSLDHSPEERIDTREYKRAIHVLKIAIEKVLAGK